MLNVFNVLKRYVRNKDDYRKIFWVRELMMIYTAGRKNFFFVEIGAHNGIENDFLYPYIVKKKWRGILVEPVKHLYDQLTSNYKNHPGLVFENVAISDKTETRDFYRLKETFDAVPSWSSQLGSFYADVLLKHKGAIPNIEDYLLVEKVQCTTLEDVLNKNKAKKVDLIKMDVEGYDYEIIKTIDFNKINPSVLIYEWKHLSDGDLKECRNLLNRNGYHCIELKDDAYAFKVFSCGFMVMRIIRNVARFCWHSCLFVLRYAYAVFACLYLFSIGCLFPRNRVLICDICSHFNVVKLRLGLRQKSKIMIQDAELKERLENEQFARYVMYLDILEFIQQKPRQGYFNNPAIIEFGGSNGIIKLMFRNYAYEIADNYPEIDIQDLSRFKCDHYDFVILDQVLEHVPNPAKGIQEVFRLLKKGGWLIITTPFLVKIHYVPNDYWRFSREGLRQLLLNYSDVVVKSWGNKDVVINHIKTGTWPSVKEVQERGCFNLENDEDLPHVVWGFAGK